MFKNEIEVWYVIIGCSVLMLFFAFILVFINIIHQKRKFNALKAEKERSEKEYLKNQQIQNEKFELILNERKRIANDLHDGVGGLLAATKMLFSKLKLDLPVVENNESFQNGYENINSASIEIREIAHNLLPKTLANNGFVDGLSELIKTINNTNQLKIDFVNYNYNKKLKPENELIIYRIIQEILNNIHKHSKSTEVSLMLQEVNDTLKITVEDFGVGFNQDNHTEGMGLIGIKERANLLGADLEINSILNEGTTFVLTIPISLNSI